MMPRELLLVAASLVLLAPTALSDTPTLATVHSTNGDPGAVWLFRAGLSQTVARGDELRLGDRIVTRPGGGVELKFDTCMAILDGLETIVIGENACPIADIRIDPPSLAAGSEVPAQGAEAGTVAGGATASSGLGTGAIVGGSVIAGAALGGIAAVISGDEDAVPASP
ncbi:MAG: hypothetical protein AAFY34_12335 [Pseudomonadota bacterium]